MALLPPNSWPSSQTLRTLEEATKLRKQAKADEWSGRITANNLLGFLLSEPMETYFVITVVCSCNVDISQFSVPLEISLYFLDTFAVGRVKGEEGI